MPARALARGLLLASMLVALAAPNAAAVSAIPDERAVILPGDPTFAAVVGDVDRDGVRELVRLLPWDVNPGQLGLEVLSIDGGEVRSHGQELVRREASVEDRVGGEIPEADALLPVGAREPTRLLAWREGGRERILAASIGTSGLVRPCCMTLWEVGIERGATALTFLQRTSASAAWVVAADLDADQTDELVVVETPDPARPEQVSVLIWRWNGSDFDRREATITPGVLSGPLATLGDSDGQPGEEVGFPGVVMSDGTGTPLLHRISMGGEGSVRTEAAPLPLSGEVLPMPGPDGGLLAVVTAGDAALARWPAGAEQMTVEATLFRGGQVLGTVGTGADARLLLIRGGSVDVLDATLTSRGGMASELAATWFAGSSWRPYIGALQGGDTEGSPAVIFQGQLITAPMEDPDRVVPGLPEVRAIAALPGKTPVGLFGPDRGWAAVADGIGPPVDRRGGSLRFAAGSQSGSVAVVPAAELLSAEADSGRIDPALTGGVQDDRQVGRPVLLTSGRVEALVRAPAGSAVRTSIGGIVQEALVGPSGVLSTVLSERTPQDRSDRSFTARLLVRTPAGHGYGARWDIRVYVRPPALAVSTPFAPLSFAVPVTGRTEPLAEVLLDGSPVTVAPDGTFTTEVAAGPVPRTVHVQAIDRVGNQTSIAVSVVGIVDYRRLPWIPIVSVITVVLGAVLYLRTPRTASPARSRPEDGSLEEIE